jgi:hypothetical protein
MRTSTLVIAIATVVALAAPANQAWAQGKGVEDTPSARPSDAPSAAPIDTPSAKPSDRPGGAGLGGRSTPAEPEPPPVIRDQPPVVRDEPPAPPERWNSAAAAIWHVRGRVRVAIGYSGIRSSAEDAKSSAVEACRNAGGSGCKALGAWNAGCLYITTGHTTNRAGWASGASTDAALKKCRGDGFTCKPPIGGCVE